MTGGNPAAPVVAPADEILQPAAVGARLSFLRAALELGTARQAAELLGFGRTRWLNWEHGVARMPVEAAARLASFFPAVSLDYIYLDRVEGMPFGLAMRLRAAAQGVPLPPLARDAAAAAGPPPAAAPARPAG